MLRMLQVPELKRAMGFSEDFRLDQGTRRDRIRLLGNAVCPPVMEAVVRSLARTEAVLAGGHHEQAQLVLPPPPAPDPRRGVQLQALPAQSKSARQNSRKSPQAHWHAGGAHPRRKNRGTPLGSRPG
jgi:C-5 cytosine-specific DNA methylase